MKNRIHLTYTITFESPFHIGTGMSQGLIDRGVARDAGGFLYIPGSTIKGILREKCEQLAACSILEETAPDQIPSPHLLHLRSFAKTPTLVESIFGSRFREGAVYFDNASLIERTSDQGLGKDFFTGREKEDRLTRQHIQQLQVETRTRTSISRQRGTVQEQALFRSEYGIRDLAFAGSIYGSVEGPGISAEICAPVVLLAAGLRLFDRIGANKSVGMGKLAFQVADDAITIETNETNEKTLEKHLHELIELLGD